MQNLKKLGLSVIASAVAGALGFGTHAASAQEYPSLTLRLSHAFPATFVQSKVDQWWADEIRSRSGGKIRINIFWAGAGGKPEEILSLVGGGAVQLGAVPPAYFPNELPLVGAPNALPATFRKNEHAQIIVTELANKIPAVKTELSKAGVHPLFFHTLNGYRPLCTKPVTKMADWAGLRIRSFGAFQPQMWNALGAVGVVVLPAEIYEGLQRGRLDCAYFSTDLHAASKLHEVGKFYSTADFGPNATWPIWINDKLWNSFTPDTRKLFEEVSAEAAKRSLKALSEADEAATKVMLDAGVKIVQFTEEEKFRQALPDMKKFWLGQMEKRGLGAEAKEVLDYWQRRQTELGE